MLSVAHHDGVGRVLTFLEYCIRYLAYAIGLSSAWYYIAVASTGTWCTHTIMVVHTMAIMGAGHWHHDRSSSSMHM